MNIISALVIGYVVGQGNVNAFCTGSNYYACTANMKNSARLQARQEAELTCSIQGGHLDQLSLFYSDSCNPPYAPPGNRQEYVSCQSQARGTCSAGPVADDLAN